MVSDNTWRNIQDIGDIIGDHAGLQFDNWAVINAGKTEWKDAMANPTNVTDEDEGNTGSNMSDTAETISKLSYKEIRNTIMTSKKTPVCSVGFVNAGLA